MSLWNRSLGQVFMDNLVRLNVGPHEEQAGADRTSKIQSRVSLKSHNAGDGKRGRTKCPLQQAMGAMQWTESFDCRMCTMVHAHAHTHKLMNVNKTKNPVIMVQKKLPSSYWAGETIKSRSQGSGEQVHEEITITYQVSHYIVIFKINGKSWFGHWFIPEV